MEEEEGAAAGNISWVTFLPFFSSCVRTYCALSRTGAQWESLASSAQTFPGHLESPFSLRRVFLPIQRRVFKGEKEEEEEEVLFLVVGCRRTGEYKKRGEGEREK